MDFLTYLLTMPLEQRRRLSSTDESFEEVIVKNKRTKAMDLGKNGKTAKLCCL